MIWIQTVLYGSKPLTSRVVKPGTGIFWASFLVHLNFSLRSWWDSPSLSRTDEGPRGQVTLSMSLYPRLEKGMFGCDGCVSSMKDSGGVLRTPTDGKTLVGHQEFISGFKQCQLKLRWNWSSPRYPIALGSTAIVPTLIAIIEIYLSSSLIQFSIHSDSLNMHWASTMC